MVLSPFQWVWDVWELLAALLWDTSCSRRSSQQLWGHVPVPVSQPPFAWEVLHCFLLDLQSCSGERSGLAWPARGGVERKEFSITCRGGSGNAWAEAAATPSPRDNTSHTGSRVIRVWQLPALTPKSSSTVHWDAQELFAFADLASWWCKAGRFICLAGYPFNLQKA